MDENDELHAAIAAYLRRHNPRAIALSLPPTPLAAAKCRSCGRPILDVGAGDLGAFGPLLAARRCVDCYLSEQAA